MILASSRNYVRRLHLIVFITFASVCWISMDRSWAATISVRYFRGTCMAAVGIPCNSTLDCGASGPCVVAAGTADDSTIVSSLQGTSMDLYRGQTSTVGSVGSLSMPQAILSAPVCWMPDWMLPDTGVLDINADPNPPVDSVEYYDYTIDDALGNNVNAMDCSNPGICSNRGWCDQVPNIGSAGFPCDDDSPCLPGTCVLMVTGCNNDAAAAPFTNGCSAHSVCIGGTMDGHLCTSSVADCGGSACSAPVAPAGSCINTNLSPNSLDVAGCLPLGDPLYVTRVVPSTVFSTCP